MGEASRLSLPAVLGVPTFAYLPYAIFNYASPLLDVAYGFTGFKIARITEDEAAQALEQFAERA